MNILKRNIKKSNKQESDKKSKKKNNKKKLHSRIITSLKTRKKHNRKIEFKNYTVYSKEFPTGPISPVLLNNLKNAWQRRNLKVLEVAPKQKDKDELITHLIGQEAVRFMSRQSKFYYIDYLEQRIRGLRKYYFYDIKKTFGEIVDVLLANNIKVFLHGGLLRDLFIGVRSTDIDIIFNTRVETLKDICEKENWPCEQIMIREQYINFGTEKGTSLEGSQLRQAFIIPIHHHESTVNDLSYDLGSQLLIDFSGVGMKDAIARRIRITPIPKYWYKWASDDFKKPLRFFKLIEKGFTPINQETLNFVVNYIREHMTDVYEGVFSPRYPISRIKHFLIRNITMGEINPETGTYSFGPNEDKLIPYLLTIKQYIGKDIFTRMLAHFTQEDLLILKNKKVITTLAKYLSSNEVKSAHTEIKSKSHLPL